LKILNLLMIFAALPLCGVAASLTLENTGVNSDGTLAATGSTDQNFYSPDGPIYVISANGAWADPGGVASYVAPDQFDGSFYGGGSYTLDYDISFDLTGLDPSSVVIEGSWSTDNSGNDILVNGQSTGNTSTGFGSFTDFTLLGSSGLFTTGINTLDFNWTNDGGPGGVAIEFSSATASPTPEPASMALFGTGLVVFGLIGRARRRVSPRQAAK
jgi:hypothetical protein